MNNKINILPKKHQEIFYSVYFENTHDGILITDRNGNILSCNPAFSILSGYEENELIGQTPKKFHSHRQNKNFYDIMWNKVISIGRWNGTIWNRRKNGEIFLVELTLIAVKSDNDSLWYIGIFTDRSTAKQALIDRSNHDPLTNLPNRYLFKDHFEFMLAHAKRNNHILAILLLDLDRFKLMNDTLGFNAGDMILIETGERLKKVVREVDAIFRLGNDEFAIILEEVSKIDDTSKIAEKILRQFAIPFKLTVYEENVYISLSIGISIYPQDGSDSQQLISNAETAMYQAKQMDQNIFQHYSPAMNAKTLKQLTMEHQLHKAIEKNEFVVYYQPVIEIKNQTIVGAEALIRWNHPELGMVSPGEFIPIAEETGLIIPIGDFVLQTACLQTKKWHEMGYKDFHIAVNLSARQFGLHDLVQRIEQIMMMNQFPHHLLNLEITESIGMRNAEQTIKILKELKMRSIQLSIDDFGTGYSSLNYLKRFPIDVLKVDQSFVRDIGVDENGENIVALIISMAHTLKLKVIAEGVETEKQLDFLTAHKCELCQGFYFSRPVPANEFTKLLEH